MRKSLLTLLAVLAMAACSEDTAGPADNTLLLDDAAVLAYGGMDMADPGTHFIARLKMLPDSIKLSSAQEEQIRTLLAAFVQTTKTDLEALAAIHQEARAAREAGKTATEIRAILARGDVIRARLHAAEAQLRADIEAVLTAAQKAWLAAARQHPCRAEDIRLTDAQKTEITALIAAFQTANKADLETIKAVFEEARAAHQNGATRAEVAAILAKASAAMTRVQAARIELDAAIRALLTPAQLASGCFARPGPGHHR